MRSRPCWQPTPKIWWNLPQVKMAKKSLLFNWAPWSLLGDCQCARSIYSVKYGDVNSTLTVRPSTRGPEERPTSNGRPHSCSYSSWYSLIYFSCETTSFERPLFGGTLSSQVSLYFGCKFFKLYSLAYTVIGSFPLYSQISPYASREKSGTNVKKKLRKVQSVCLAWTNEDTTACDVHKLRVSEHRTKPSWHPMTRQSTCVLYLTRLNDELCLVHHMARCPGTTRKPAMFSSHSPPSLHLIFRHFCCTLFLQIIIISLSASIWNDTMRVCEFHITSPPVLGLRGRSDKHPIACPLHGRLT